MKASKASYRFQDPHQTSLNITNGRLKGLLYTASVDDARIPVKISNIALSDTAERNTTLFVELSKICAPTKIYWDVVLSGDFAEYSSDQNSQLCYMAMNIALGK